MPEPLQNAITHLERNIGEPDDGDGVDASIIFAEGDKVWYLDEDCTVLNDEGTWDRSLAIMSALLTLSLDKVITEQQRRRREGVANARSPLRQSDD